jgi:hypothetical protein
MSRHGHGADLPPESAICPDRPVIRLIELPSPLEAE